MSILTLEEIFHHDLTYLTRKAGDELEALSGRTVWFTGAAGFLGYYFCKGIIQLAGRRIRLLAIVQQRHTRLTI